MIRILIIEANREHARLIRERLKADLGSATVEIASSASKGISLLQKGSFDCILTDYSTPELSGPRLLRKLREAADELPIIVVTGRTGDRIASEVIRWGATDYLQKSKTSLETLPELVRKAVLKRRWQRSPLLLPAQLIGKVLEEVEETLLREVRRIRRNAGKLLK